jgi:hypothetical protein
MSRPDLWDDPTADPSGPYAHFHFAQGAQILITRTLTPFHLITFGSGALSLLAGNMRLPPDMLTLVGMWKRINALLVGYEKSYLVMEPKG